MRVIVSIFLLVSTCIAFSQSNTVKINPKLYEKYTAEFLEDLSKENPGQIAYLNFYVENACYIIDMPEKPIKCVLLEKKSEDPVTAADLEDFNLYEFNVLTKENERRYYKAGNTGKLIVVRSNKEIRRMFENAKRSTSKTLKK